MLCPNYWPLGTRKINNDGGFCNSTWLKTPGIATSLASAISRALIPVRLAGPELKFLRRALDMSQKEFAAAMELTPETVSRWENDVRGVGGMCEKLVRHNICALLYKDTKGRPYDPAVIANMRFTDLPDGESLPPIEMVRVRVVNESPTTDGWAMAA